MSQRGWRLVEMGMIDDTLGLLCHVSEILLVL